MATEETAAATNQPSLLDSFPLTFRFGVTFFIGGVVPNQLDTRFQKVSGLSSEIETTTINEGGRNLHSHSVPTKVTYGNLVLERGMMSNSLLNLEFNAAMTTFSFLPSNVLVVLYNEQGEPVSSWMFIKAYPVKWSVGDLDANQDQIVIETMELAYDKYITIRL